MSLLSNEDEYQVFQCPNCKKHVSTKLDACRFCAVPFDDLVKKNAVESSINENREYRIKTHKAMLYAGIAMFGLGILLVASSMFTIFMTGQARFFIWSPIITLVGIGQIIMGLKGIREERKKK